jgi:hypothetical protein
MSNIVIIIFPLFLSNDSAVNMCKSELVDRQRGRGYCSAMVVTGLLVCIIIRKLRAVKFIKH